MKSSTIETTCTLTAAADLVRCIVQTVAGAEIAESLDGNPLTNEVMNHTALTGFQSLLSQQESRRV